MGYKIEKYLKAHRVEVGRLTIQLLFLYEYHSVPSKSYRTRRNGLPKAKV